MSNRTFLVQAVAKMVLYERRLSDANPDVGPGPMYSTFLSQALKNLPGVELTSDELEDIRAMYDVWAKKFDYPYR